MEYPIVPNGNNCNSNSCTGNSGGGLNSVYKGKSVSQKLMELYQEELQRQPEDEPLCYATHLLAKLVKRDRLNCLVLNLYPANEGYSLMLKGRNGMESETIKLPYEESELLEYIDASELPPILVDILEKAQVNVFHSGCVIVEVRDYRRSSNGTYDSEYIMLKPTMQSLLCDINSLTNDGHRWTQEDVFQLESQLLLATQDPLCLDPNPAIFFAMNHQQYENKKFNDPALRQSVKKYSQAAVNRKRKFAKAPAPKELRLLDFISRKRLRKGAGAIKPIPDSRNYKPPNLSPPQNIDVDKYASEKPMEKKTADNNLSLVEEHILEVELAEGQKEVTRIAFLQRLSDEIYFGEQSDGNMKGEKCRFQLGTRENVDKYFEQFKMLFIKNYSTTIQNFVVNTNRPNASPQVSVINPATCSSPLSTMSMPMNQETNNQGIVTRKGSSQHLSVSVGSSGNSAQQNTVSPSTPAISPGVGNTTASSQQSTNSQSQSHSGQSQKGRQHAM